MTKKEIEKTKEWIRRTYKNINYYEEHNMKITKKYEIGRFLGILGLADELGINTLEIFTWEEQAKLANEFLEDRDKEF